MQPAISVDVEPLIRSLADRNAVVYVGAGASMDAGLPSWKQFLHECLDRANKYRDQSKQLTRVSKLVSDGEYLLAAEILQNILESDLPYLIRSRFRDAKRPTEVHAAIASLPFSIALTTNYDRLLELAYAPPAQILTWQKAEDILLALRERTFLVGKIHGDVSVQSSLVLTRTNYRQLMHLNQAFKTCMKTLLLNRTFLFVGCSLRDHDLLSLIDEARSEFDAGFGPHFAILLDSETDEYLESALRDCYRIHVIRVPSGDMQNQVICSMTGRTLTLPSISARVAHVLTRIGGEVALRTQQSYASLPVFDSQFTLRRVVENIVKKAAHLCGAHRVEVALVSQNHDGQKAVYRQASFSSHDPAVRFYDDPELCSFESLQGRLFLQRKINDDFIYISDLRDGRQQLDDQGFVGLDCSASHNDTESLLACPIYTDGRRSGILTIESERPRAFSADHLKVVHALAREIGWAHFEAKERLKASLPLHQYFKRMDRFESLMNQSRLLAELQLEYLLYKIDSFTGEMKGFHYDEGMKMTVESPIRMKFSEQSLATCVLRERRKIEADTNNPLDFENGKLSKRGVHHFHIRGKVFGLPIHCRGVTAGVLVCWFKKLPRPGDSPKNGETLAAVDEKRILNARDEKYEECIERARRMSHLIANDPEEVQNRQPDSPSAASFVSQFNNLLSVVDNGAHWTSGLYLTNRQRVFDALIRLLVQDGAGFRRARLWLRTTDDSGTFTGFECIKSVSREDSTYPGTKATDAYSGLQISPSDSYSRYICIRAEYDPYARSLDEGMLSGIEESLGSDLHKKRGGTWVIAPVLAPRARSGGLLGFVAADMHYYDQDQGEVVEQSVEEAIQVFQRYCLDIVTDVLSTVIYVECIDRNRRRHDQISTSNTSIAKGTDTETQLTVSDTETQSSTAGDAQGVPALNVLAKKNRIKRKKR